MNARRTLFVLLVFFVLLSAAGARAQEEDLDLDGREALPSVIVRKLEALLGATPPASGDRNELAVFHHQRGQAHLRLGNYPRAIEDLQLALQNATRDDMGEWGVRWRIRNQLSIALAQGGNPIAARESWEAIAAESRKSRPALFHFASANAASIASQLGQFTAASQALKDANDASAQMRGRTFGPSTEEFRRAMDARVGGQLATRRGGYAEAERFFRIAVEAAERDLDLKKRSRPADHQDTRAAQTFLSTNRILLSDVMADRGNYGEAEILARAGLEGRLAMLSFNTVMVGSALAAVGWARLQQGDLESAASFSRRAFVATQRSQASADSPALAARRAGLGNVLVAQGRWTEALTVFDDRDRDLRTGGKRGPQRHVSWALALHKSGDSQRAADMAAELIAAELRRQPAPRKYVVAQMQGTLAMALSALGRHDEALGAFQEAIPEIIRRDHDDVTSEESGYWRAYWRRLILEMYLELLAKLGDSAHLPAGRQVADEAFRIADLARNSGVQEAIGATAARAQLPDGNLRELARKEQDTLNRVVALNQLLSRLASATGDERLNKVISDMRAEIERLRREHAGLRADIRKRYPEYAELIDPRPAGLADVSASLASGGALVSIYVGESQSYVWTVAAGGKAAFRVLPVRREEVERDVGELRRALDLAGGGPGRLRAFDSSLAYKLYRVFLEPDEALWRDAQVLNVIPHGALAQVPLGLLITAAPSGTGEASYREMPWLIRKVAIAQLPSASAFSALRRAPAARGQRQPFIGFGDPVFTADAGARAGEVRSLVVRKVADDTEAQIEAAMRGGQPPAASSPAPTLSRAFSLLSALPDTSAELREIAAMLKADPAKDVFVNQQATEKNVKQVGLDNRRVVAFATHGIAPGEVTGLDQPALVLSNPALTGDADNDGFLTMEEVLGLKLDADWVVLSACNTASADGRGSEAVSGLGRAFFFAGARSLLVSNWAVETTSARLLTTELFKRQVENPQLTRAEALRQSMLDLMGKAAPGGFSYAHPAFWAPFSLVGDGGR